MQHVESQRTRSSAVMLRSIRAQASPSWSPVSTFMISSSAVANWMRYGFSWSWTSLKCPSLECSPSFPLWDASCHCWQEAGPSLQTFLKWQRWGTYRCSMQLGIPISNTLLDNFSSVVCTGVVCMCLPGSVLIGSYLNWQRSKCTWAELWSGLHIVHCNFFHDYGIDVLHIK